MPTNLASVGMGPRDQYLATIQVLEARGVDTRALKQMYEKANMAGQGKNQEAQMAAEKVALAAVGQVLDKSYSAEIAKKQEGAGAERIKLVTALLEEARSNVKELRLTYAVGVYQRALDALKGD